MGRPKATKSAPESTDAAEPTPNTVSKADAARAALAAGIENPQEAVAFMKERFGVDMNPQHFSTFKSQWKKKGAATPVKRGRRPKAAVEGYRAATPKQSASGDGLIDSLEALKPLIAQYGSDKVKKLVDLLG